MNVSVPSSMNSSSVNQASSSSYTDNNNNNGSTSKDTSSDENQGNTNLDFITKGHSNSIVGSVPESSLAQSVSDSLINVVGPDVSASINSNGSNVVLRTGENTKISAYARLDFNSFTFYIQTLQVVLGRRINNDQLHSVDVHLGPRKAVSRKHAKIFYNFGTQRFEISVLGRNGLFINNNFVEKGLTVPLSDGNKIQIGQIAFTFVLPGSLIDDKVNEQMAQPQQQTATQKQPQTQQKQKLQEQRHPQSVTAFVDQALPESKKSQTTPAQPSTQTLTQTQPQSQSQAQSKSEPQSQSQAQTKSEPQSQSQAQTKSEPHSQTQPQAQSPSQTSQSSSKISEPAEPKPKQKTSAKSKEQPQTTSIQEPATKQPSPASSNAIKLETKLETVNAFDSLNQDSLLFADKLASTTNVKIEPQLATDSTITGKQNTDQISNNINNNINNDNNNSNATDSADISVPNLSSLASFTGTDFKPDFNDPTISQLLALTQSTNTPTSSQPPIATSFPSNNVTVNNASPNSASKAALASTVPKTVKTSSPQATTMAPLTPLPSANSNIQSKPAASASVAPKKEKRPAKQPKKVYTLDEIPEPYRTKPATSYSNIIVHCLRTYSVENKGMSLSEIYKSIQELYPYYKYCPDGWQSSVRHNLSLNKAFKKISKEGKGWLWGLDEDYFAEKDKAKKKQQTDQARNLNSMQSGTLPQFNTTPGVAGFANSKSVPFYTTTTLPPSTYSAAKASKSATPTPSNNKPAPKLSADDKKILNILQDQLRKITKNIKGLNKETVIKMLTIALSSTMSQLQKNAAGQSLIKYVEKNPQELTKILTVSLNTATTQVTNGKMTFAELISGKVKPSIGNTLGSSTSAKPAAKSSTTGKGSSATKAKAAENCTTTTTDTAKSAVTSVSKAATSAGQRKLSSTTASKTFSSATSTYSSSLPSNGVQKKPTTTINTQNLKPSSIPLIPLKPINAAKVNTSNIPLRTSLSNPVLPQGSNLATNRGTGSTNSSNTAKPQSPSTVVKAPVSKTDKSVSSVPVTPLPARAATFGNKNDTRATTAASSKTSSVTVKKAQSLPPASGVPQTKPRSASFIAFENNLDKLLAGEEIAPPPSAEIATPAKPESDVPKKRTDSLIAFEQKLDQFLAGEGDLFNNAQLSKINESAIDDEDDEDSGKQKVVEPAGATTSAMGAPSSHADNKSSAFDEATTKLLLSLPTSNTASPSPSAQLMNQNSSTTDSINDLKRPLEDANDTESGQVMKKTKEKQS